MQTGNQIIDFFKKDFEEYMKKARFRAREGETQYGTTL